MPTALITGASRGIGLEITRAFARRGWDVVATCRDPAGAEDLRALAAANPNVEVRVMDVADHASIEAAAAELDGRAIDVLVNNAGIAHRDTRLGSIDYDRWRAVMDVNLLAPVKVLESFLPHLLLGEHRKAVSISSSLGSVAMTRGDNYFYRTSKAALNMAMRSIGKDLAAQGVMVAVVSPGFVDTDLTRSVNMPKVSAAESGEGIAAYLEAMTPEQAARFLRYNGEEVPW